MPFTGKRVNISEVAATIPMAGFLKLEYTYLSGPYHTPPNYLDVIINETIILPNFPVQISSSERKK